MGQSQQYTGVIKSGRAIKMTHRELQGMLKQLSEYQVNQLGQIAMRYLTLICNDRCQEAISLDSGSLRDLPTEGISKGLWNQISGIGHSDIRGFGGCRTSTLPTG